jgi:hypothetical protein
MDFVPIVVKLGLRYTGTKHQPNHPTGGDNERGDAISLSNPGT